MFFTRKAKNTKNEKPTISESDALFSAMSNFCATIYFLPDGTITDANPLFLSAVGYSLEEIKGQHHSILCPDGIKNSEEYKGFWPRLAY